MQTVVESKPIRVDNVEETPIYVFNDDSNYSDAFGYEWENYSRTYTDSSLGDNVSLRRLELNLGFPVEFLRDKTVLEIGSGQGRFTEHLAEHSKEVITSDMSKAIYYNVALHKPNIIAIKADVNDFPKLSKEIDIVFCRGVIQHTANPKQTIHDLFSLVPVGGLVIFDVYKKTKSKGISFKYFWRPVLQKTVNEESFDRYIKKHSRGLYNWHHRVVRFMRFLGPVGKLLRKLPIYYDFDWDKQYAQLNREQREEVFRNELIDMFYSAYDQPMSAEEVIEALAEIGQTPYSYDVNRNHFRCKKTAGTEPIKVKTTKNGVVPVD